MQITSRQHIARAEVDEEKHRGLRERAAHAEGFVVEKLEAHAEVRRG